MKIVVLDGYTENPGDLSWEAMAGEGDLTVYDRTPLSEIVGRIGDAEAIFVNKTPISRDILEKCPNLKFIGVLATGFNVIDVEAAREKGVYVCNVPSYGTDAVAQFAMALLLEVCHHVGAHDQSVRKGNWTQNPDWCYWEYPLIELKGKCLGIIGYGKIGKRTAQLAQAFGMHVLVYTRHPGKEETVSFVTLDELLKQADVISLHCPLTGETEGIVCEETIGKMKDGVILINTSRGPLICEEDLASALRSGKVAGAAVDVVSVEPVREENPLLHAPNIIMTPHIAWASKEARQRLMDTAVENLIQFKNGTPQNVVNGVK
ncbi:MAG: D-2-hydroxyacid dehydrogenase [Lachnospiraceae bacterium]|nr:D-2-hydroxyacid dehydrogenase [Lachnospiraceae bacterium]